jgi:excisionase family DNA binding protein
MTDSERWLSVEEIGLHLGVSKETVYRWLEKKKIPAHKLGRLWKFKASEVDQWVSNGGAEENSSQNERPKNAL